VETRDHRWQTVRIADWSNVESIGGIHGRNCGGKGLDIVPRCRHVVWSAFLGSVVAVMVVVVSVNIEGGSLWGRSHGELWPGWCDVHRLSISRQGRICEGCRNIDRLWRWIPARGSVFRIESGWSVGEGGASRISMPG